MTAPALKVAPTEAICDSDSKAPSFGAVFSETNAQTWRLLRRLGVAEQDIPDVLQDVFLVVHRQLCGFEGRSSVRTWVYRIAVRTARDHFRRAHRRYETPTDEVPEATTPAHQERYVAMREQCALLDELLAELDPEKRAVFTLFEIEELTMDEVATAMDCPLKTAYARLYAARKQVSKAHRRRQRSAL